MNRREMIFHSTSSVGSLAIGLMATSAAAAAAAVSEKNAQSGVKFLKLAEANQACVKTGLICIAQCQRELAQGHKEMAECLQSVLELVSACENLEKLALYESKHTQEFARLTAKICSECEKICEKHSGHMESCKACMEACKQCEKECLAA